MRQIAGSVALRSEVSGSSDEVNGIRVDDDIDDDDD